MPRKSGQALDQKLVELLACGSTAASAARSAGCDRKTVYRRNRDPEFRQRVDEFRNGMLSSAAGRLAASAGDAIDCLVKLLRAESDSIRLGAVRALLDAMLKTNELARIESRIAALELLAGSHVSRSGDLNNN